MNEEVIRDAMRGIRGLLSLTGRDVYDESIADTPRRFVSSFIERTIGYSQDPKEILATGFEDSYDEMVLLRNIDFASTCEHHLLPFIGTATVAYIPSDGKVVGISKLARLVDCFAMRLQLQERLTKDIADAIETHLQPKGVGVIIIASHQCMTCRGVKKSNAEMVTSIVKGAMRDEIETRHEFLAFKK